MMNDEIDVLPCPKRAFSNVLEGVDETFEHDKCFSIHHLHLKGIKFIAIENRSKQHWFISFEFTCLILQLET